MKAALHKVRWRTIPLRAAAALIGLVVTVIVTYFVTINALLMTGVGKIAINRIAPAHAHFEWQSAYSPWFMRVHTTGFVFRGEDSSVQWLITADRANATFGLLDFSARRVRLHDAWATGVTARIRFKLDPADATADYVAKLPPIAGFAGAPLKPAVMPPAPTDEHYNLWTVEIDDAVGESVREVWVDTIHAVDTGGYVAGGFYLKPLRRLFVRPTECRIQDGTVHDGTDTIVSGLHGTFELHIAELDLVAAHGAEVIHHIDAKAKAQAKVGDLHFLDPWLRAEHIAVAGGSGPTELAMELQRGVLVTGSRAWMRSDGFHVWSGHDGLSGTAFVNALVPEGKPYLALTVETYGLGIHRDRTTVASVPAASMLVHVDNLDLGKPFDRWAASIDAPSIVAHDLRALNAYLGETLLLAGSGAMGAHANITPDTISGHANVDLSNAVIDVSKTPVTLSGTGEVTLHGFDRRSGRGDLAGARVSLQDVAGGNQRGWWVNLSANPLSVTFKHGLSISGMVTGKFRDAQLPLAVLDASDIVRNAFGSHGFTGASEFHLSRNVTDLTDFRFIGDTVELRAHYHTSDGAAFVRTPLINVGVLVHNGETSTHMFVTRDWYNRTLGTKPRADKR